ncbi:MAG: hypothetical protein KDK44_01430 [Chlamydiia bacterium]|nr:hypothetical protein [Chlamydiia bacterium]MCP5509381.1 hypothetical protein [Chlamydiales bacterium]HPE84599.1 hypothetical protein [Chlamydiales bacterium]
MKKLNIWGFCLAIAIVWSAGTILAGWFAGLGWGDLYVRVMSSIYIGYEPGFWGGIIGGIWAFFDGGIFGLAISFLYNVFSEDKKKPKAAKKKR